MVQGNQIHEVELISFTLSSWLIIIYFPSLAFRYQILSDLCDKYRVVIRPYALCYNSLFTLLIPNIPK